MDLIDINNQEIRSLDLSGNSVICTEPILINGEIKTKKKLKQKDFLLSNMPVILLLFYFSPAPAGHFILQKCEKG